MRILLVILFSIIQLSINAQFASRVPVGAVSTGVLNADASSNMLTDGTFDNGTTYWEPETAAWTVPCCNGAYDRTGTSALAQTDGDMQSSIQINTAYTLNLDISGLSAGSANIRIENYDGSVQYTSATNYANGNHDIQFTTPASVSPGGLRVRASITSGSAFDIDNLVLTAD